MPFAKHKVTGLVVEVQCAQLKDPQFSEVFVEVEGDAACVDCRLPDPPATEPKETKTAKKEGGK